MEGKYTVRPMGSLWVFSQTAAMLDPRLLFTTYAARVQPREVENRKTRGASKNPGWLTAILCQSLTLFLDPCMAYLHRN